jgi:CBS domain containing-hemolysin-like protein
MSAIGELVALRIGRAPKEGETFDEQGCRFEILDLDAMRVDQVLITPLNSGSPLLKPGARSSMNRSTGTGIT